MAVERPADGTNVEKCLHTGLDIWMRMGAGRRPLGKLDMEVLETGYLSY